MSGRATRPISANDYLRLLGEDPDTKVATLYVEGFRDGERFLQAARDHRGQARGGVPVRLYRTGCQGRQLPHRRTGGQLRDDGRPLRQVG